MCCNWCLAGFAATLTLWGTASIFLENTSQDTKSNKVYGMFPHPHFSARTCQFQGRQFQIAQSMDFYKLTLKSNTVIVSEAPPEWGQHPGNGGWTFSHVFLPTFVPSRVNTGISPRTFQSQEKASEIFGAGWQ